MLPLLQPAVAAGQQRRSCPGGIPGLREGEQQMAHGQGFAASATAERDQADRAGRTGSRRIERNADQQDRATGQDRAARQRATTCVVIRPNAIEQQGLTLTTGVSRETVGSNALCMRLMMLPPGTRGTPHSHKGHESAIWVAMGEAEIWHGPGLCGRTVVHAGRLPLHPARHSPPAGQPQRDQDDGRGHGPYRPGRTRVGHPLSTCPRTWTGCSPSRSPPRSRASAAASTAIAATEKPRARIHDRGFSLGVSDGT